VERCLLSPAAEAKAVRRPRRPLDRLAAHGVYHRHPRSLSHSAVMKIETHEVRCGSLQACRRRVRTIFLGSEPTTADQTVRGIDAERVLLGVLQAANKLASTRMRCVGCRTGSTT
jgi:hypothetical protein